MSTGTAPRRPRAEWVALVAPLRERGLMLQQIADRLGISRQFVSDLLNDPDRSRQRVRRERYRRACPGWRRECGALMDGSNGNGPSASRLCVECDRLRIHDERKWTAETVVDAIQRFAEEHGRPPFATEWVHADPVNGYPCSRACYRSTHDANKSAPFAKWADAVEAAGFPRPEPGKYERTAKHAS